MHCFALPGPLRSSIAMEMPSPSLAQAPPATPEQKEALDAVLAMFWSCSWKVAGKVPVFFTVTWPWTYCPDSIPAPAIFDVWITVPHALLTTPVQVAAVPRFEAAWVMLLPLDELKPVRAPLVSPMTLSISSVPAAKVFPGFVVTAVNVANVPTLTSEPTTPIPITVRQTFLNTPSFITLSKRGATYLGFPPAGTLH